MRADKNGNIIWVCTQCTRDWRDHSVDEKIECTSKHQLSLSRLPLLSKE